MTSPFISIIGLNHKSAPVELRERLSFGADKLKEILSYCCDSLSEFVLISTCNRTEFIFNGEQSILEKYLMEVGSLQESDFESFFYRYNDYEALEHLFRVASGLDSLVVGEVQILGQVKSAFELSFEQNYATANFAHIYQQMLKCARQVRRDTEIGKGSVSVASIAVQLSKNIFDHLSGKKVLLIGAGEMCELAGVHFFEAGVDQIMVANRSVENAEKLADKFKGKAFSLDQLEDAVWDADIILSSTGSPSYVLEKDLIKGAMSKRREPMFLIDIAVPRDIDPKINDLTDVFVYNIDDLNKIAEENRKKRGRAFGRAEEIVETKLKEFREEQALSSVGPLINSFRERLHGIKDDEQEKLFRKLSHLSDSDKDAINKSLHQIVNKLLHDPIITLRDEVKRDDSSRLVKVFKDLFNL
ncbi:glutamyl-tRNA reductase [Lentisphaera marina]|uniref:glutamyl-tRNA reductase n=1 Tax=Lentisphaera marina TaxID=1111041 RepID=UPI00236732CD|nr:glutamyl-tRNA reductase [Lentisphaera marina]MDD7985610.1 glutamyl-tRNA reductase [Lentisphaera marina]